MSSSDPVPDVPPTGTTTVTTTPPLFGLFGGSSATTTISVTPETASAAVSAVSPPPSTTSSPTTAQTVIGETTKTFFWAFGVAVGACALYLVSLQTGIQVPTGVLLLIALVPYTTWFALLALLITTVFSGRVSLDPLRGRMLSEVFGIRSGPKPI